MPQLDWKARLTRSLPAFGHRNWIVIADAAYPAHAASAIRTIVCPASHLEVLQFTLAALSQSRHLAPKALIDQELSFVHESDAPGISAWRTQLAGLLPEPLAVPHEELLTRLDDAARLFRVLILKTTMDVPYTSVFLELDCAYWNAASEDRLRSAINQNHDLPTLATRR